MSIFGWSYPAGAENDPNAPYNQEDPPDVDLEDPVAGEDDDCPFCGDVASWDAHICLPRPENKLTSPEPGFMGWVCHNCGWAQEAVSDDFRPAKESLDAQKESLLKDYEEFDVPSPNTLPVLAFEKYIADFPEAPETFHYKVEWAEEMIPEWCDVCETWHPVFYGAEFSRQESGNFVIEIVTCDVDGNWETVDGYETFEDSDGKAWEEFYRWRCLVGIETGLGTFRAWRNYRHWQFDHYGEKGKTLDCMDEGARMNDGGGFSLEDLAKQVIEQDKMVRKCWDLLMSAVPQEERNT